MADNQTRDAGFTDSELGHVVLERNLATPEELADCLGEKKRLSTDNRQRSLGEVLVDRGVITPRQLQRVRRSLEQTRPKHQIPGYRLLSLLGSGAMATVFKAEQLSLNRPVAIKVLHKRYSEDPEYVERFYREGQAAAKLNHPNIVQAIDVGEAGGFHYFVMEYVEGHTLYDELAKGKVFSETEGVGIILQVAQALAHAHERGLIHRDIKPKNVMVTNDGAVKLADMGLARLASDQQAAQAEAGRAFGTPYYISPEQVRGEVDIDFRADIYGLGATLYHLVTGRVPFEAATPAAVMHKHLREPLTPPDHINTALSVGLGEIVEVMMAKNRQDRYASTKDLIADLEAVARGEPPLVVRKVLDAHVLSGLAKAGEPVPRSPARQGPSGLVMALYVILALLTISILFNIVQAVR